MFHLNDESKSGDFRNEITAKEQAEYKQWLETLNQVENEAVCPTTCGGVNFPTPPEYNYEVYERIICPECGCIDWKWVGESI
jgi:hypothetical protein